ncbi:MAG: hypothetical protein U5L11_07145 [Arhodomonas sp.]|nr:hypothetical protein [Arhodomonas sp.]
METSVSATPPSDDERSGNPLPGAAGQARRCRRRASRAARRSPNRASIGAVLDTARRVMLQDGACAAIETRIQALEEAGLFEGSDWATPQILVPSLTTHALQSPDTNTVVIEALSELRLLAVAQGDYLHPPISAEQAHHYLTQVLAINLAMLFSAPGEAERDHPGRLAELLSARCFRHLAERIGYEHIIDQLIDEIWRMLRQRPIQVDPIKQMITQIAICRADPAIDLGASGHGAERLVEQPVRPHQRQPGRPGHGGLPRNGSAAMDNGGAAGPRPPASPAPCTTPGSVSPYHAAFLRFLRGNADHLLADALGLSHTGRDGLLCYRELVMALIDEAVTPATAQSVYGLAMLLERGILYQSAVAPALWRQIALPLSDWAANRLWLAYGDGVAPRSLAARGGAVHARPAPGGGPGQQPHLPVRPGAVHVGLQRSGLPAADRRLGRPG